MNNISIVKDCCGCEVCGNICPVEAIDIEKDEIGFAKPVVNLSCISCGKCLKICPMYNRKPEKNEFEYYYGMSHKKTEVLINSASGGVFTFLVKEFLKQYPEGWLCGAVYKEDFSEVEHIISREEKDFQRMRSSKYLQSKKNDIYKAVQEKIVADEAVLFTGSPCEVDALIRFLGKKYEKLWTIDYVCKGTTTPKVYMDFIKKLKKKYKSRVTTVNMRYKWEKLDNWIPQFFCVKFENGKRFLKQFYNTEPGLAFMLLQRKSCATCPYREKKHYSDYTIGDFHGKSAEKEYGNKLGTSVLIINNKEMHERWHKMDKSELFCAKSDKEEIYDPNRSIPDSRSELLFENLCKYDGVKAVRRTVGIRERIKMTLPTKLMRFLTMKKKSR